MNPASRKAMLAGVALVLLLLLTAWNYARLSRHRSAAAAAAQETLTCEQFAADIANLERQPLQVGSTEIQLSEWTHRIEQSAADSHIASNHLIRIWPQQATRIGNTPYKAKSTQVLLRDVSLPQAVRFLYALETQDAGPRTTQLRLNAPRDEDKRGTWTIESSLTHVIYAPQAQQPARNKE